MLDFLNNEIHIGDKLVVASHHGKNSGASLSIGEVFGFTKCYVKLEEIKWGKNVKISPEKVISVSALERTYGKEESSEEQT